ncbi:MAG TPA: amino acid adenylation domain-containing protein, partial [Campylobacterales bacterium]|nr:amino acid adenylation domain-containing protein [Campylobacterales bacterium]
SETNYDLLIMIHALETITISFQYNGAVYSTNTLRNIKGSLEKLIDDVLKNPETLVADLDIISQEEYQLLESFNQTEQEYPKDKTIIELFEEQVARTPDNIAVVYEDREFTYAQINQQANALGAYLVELGVKPNDLIAIHIDRSIEMMIGLLGILKSKAAYIPIDPSYPLERIEYMIEDSGVNIIITENKYVEDLVSLSDSKVLSLSNMNEIVSQYPNENLNKEVNLDDLAYVIYTSGSTGKPKGTLLTHKNLNNYIYWAMDAYQPKRGVGIPVQSSFAFDATITSLYLPILSGGKTILLPEREEIEGLAELLKKSNPVSLIKITPSHLKILNEQLSEDEFSNATHALVLGGEALSPSDIQPWLKDAPHVHLINEYGPTESVVGCCVYDAKGDTELVNSVPIGKPIANTKLYILNKEQKEQPLGSIGELYIGGDGLAKGYLNKPELTEKVFIVHEKLGRIYKTGDIARYREDGNIEYLGRVDDQVKIRGFRIELGEIESSILEYQGIKEAVVIAKEEQLIAYVIEDECQVEDNDLLEELRSALTRKLPSYMLPSHIVKLESIPLTPNGKIDKKALASLETGSCHKEYVKAVSETEIKLSNIYKEILKHKEVSIKDSFFEIGGHSLTAISTMAQIGKSFEVEIKLKEFFSHSSIESLAQLIESKTKTEYQKIEKLAEQESYAISNAQRRLWVLDQMQEGSNVYNLPGALRFEEALDVALIEKSLEVLIQRHEILRTNFKESDGEVRQVIHAERTITVEESVIEEEKLNTYLVAEAKALFDLEQDSLIVVKVINQKVLFVNMHHIISDGWSIAVIIKELSSIYTALATQKEPKLNALSIQYKEYSHWQNTLLKNQAYLEKHQSYWHKVLKGHQPLEFPLDYTRPSSQSFEGANLSFKLTKDRTDKLKKFAQDSTLFTVLLTLTNILLAKYSNQEEIILGTPVANRGHEQLFEQIGFYVNTLALRTKLNMQESFEKNLLEIKASVLEAFEHQSYPFDKLVDELNLERDLSQNPLFNMMIVLQNNEQNELNFNNNPNVLEVIDTQSTKFDMTFNYTEVEYEIEVGIEYNTQLFNSSTIERLLDNLETLIDNLSLTTVLNDVNVISSKEQTLLESFNQTEQAYPKDKTIIELFEEQVARTPDNIAVVYEDREFTYAQINQKANSLGAYLRENYAVKANTIVPIMLDRSEWMIIAILGVLKAGGAYLPIDPHYPLERIQYILRDSKANVVLHDSNNATQANTYESLAVLKVLNVQTLDVYDGIESINLECMNSVHDLAYVIYTSGSTGQPKGVMLAHKGAVNRIEWMQKKYDLDSNDTILQKTPFSFDVSVWELLLPMMYGVKLVFAKPDGHKDNTYLIDLIN